MPTMLFKFYQMDPRTKLVNELDNQFQNQGELSPEVLDNDDLQTVFFKPQQSLREPEQDLAKQNLLQNEAQDPDQIVPNQDHTKVNPSYATVIEPSQDLQNERDQAQNDLDIQEIDQASTEPPAGSNMAKSEQNTKQSKNSQKCCCCL